MKLKVNIKKGVADIYDFYRNIAWLFYRNDKLFMASNGYGI